MTRTWRTCTKRAFWTTDGYAGDAYYEDDEAIEYIVESLAAKNALDPEQAVKLAALVDDYLDAQQMFLESQGMVEYEE